jgi:hypothetical protein
VGVARFDNSPWGACLPKSVNGLPKPACVPSECTPYTRGAPNWVPLTVTATSVPRHVRNIPLLYRYNSRGVGNRRAGERRREFVSLKLSLSLSLSTLSLSLSLARSLHRSIAHFIARSLASRSLSLLLQVGGGHATFQIQPNSDESDVSVQVLGPELPTTPASDLVDIVGNALEDSNVL